MKDERMKLLTFRSLEWKEEWTFHKSPKHELLHPSKNKEQEQRASNAGSVLGRKKVDI
jgi:hypothetical protein